MPHRHGPTALIHKGEWCGSELSVTVAERTDGASRADHDDVAGQKACWGTREFVNLLTGVSSMVTLFFLRAPAFPALFPKGKTPLMYLILKIVGLCSIRYFAAHFVVIRTPAFFDQSHIAQLGRTPTNQLIRHIYKRRYLTRPHFAAFFI